MAYHEEAVPHTGGRLFALLRVTPNYIIASGNLCMTPTGIPVGDTR